MDTINAGIDETLFSSILEAVQKTPFYSYLGVKLKLLAPGYAEIYADPTVDHTNPLGAVHGGFIMTVADMAMGNAIRNLGLKCVTVDCSISYLSEARPGPILLAKGKVVKSGKTLHFAEGFVFSGEKMVAHSKGTFFKVDEWTY